MVREYQFEDGEYYCDGGCKRQGTKHAKAYGSWSGPDGEVHADDYENCNTNQQAEYQALITLLELMPNDLTATIHSDSLLVVSQLSGEWKVNEGPLEEFFDYALDLLRIHPNVTIEWISGAEMKRILGH